MKTNMPVTEEVAGAEELRKNRILAAVCYIWLLFVLPFALAKDSRYALFHARQGAVLFAFSLLASLLIRFAPPGLEGAADLITVGWIAFIATGITNAWKGRLRPLPLLGRLWRGPA